MTTWDDTYRHAVDRFGGQHPGFETENRIADHYITRPAAVEQAITKIADRYDRGKIHSPWPLVLKEIEHAAERETITPANDDRERHIRLAETYIRNAAIYCPTETELVDEIFGDHGRLKPWAADDALRDRILELYRTDHPRALTAEADARARAAGIRATREAKPPAAAWDDATEFAA